jgi:hypothetical protein
VTTLINFGARLFTWTDLEGAKPADLPVQQATKFGCDQLEGSETDRPNRPAEVWRGRIK